MQDLYERFMQLTNGKPVGPAYAEVAMGRQLEMPRTGGWGQQWSDIAVRREATGALAEWFSSRQLWRHQRTSGTANTRDPPVPQPTADHSAAQRTLGGMGSAMANSGSARLANVLRYASTGLFCSTKGS